MISRLPRAPAALPGPHLLIVGRLSLDPKLDVGILEFRSAISAAFFIDSAATPALPAVRQRPESKSHLDLPLRRPERFPDRGLLTER